MLGLELGIGLVPHMFTEYEAIYNSTDLTYTCKVYADCCRTLAQRKENSTNCRIQVMCAWTSIYRTD